MLKNVFRQMAGIDLRSLAAFRIGLAFVLLWDLTTSLTSVREFYSDAGFLPLGALAQFQESPWLWSIHAWSGSVTWQIALLSLHIAAAVCLLIGFRTQAAVVLCWALLSSLQVRNPTILHSGDAALRLLCFWAIFLPLGARGSVDERRGRCDEFRAANTIATWPALAILVQISLIYWMGAWMKSGDEWRRDGTAIYYALSLDQFVTGAGRRLLQFPNVCRALTFGTWWLEVIGPALAFIPMRTGVWRLIVVGAFWGLHIGLWLCFRLGPFPLTMMTAWLLFLPACVWNALATRTRLASDSSSQTPRVRSWMTGPLTQGFALFCLVYATLWNLRGVDFKRWDRWFPQWVNPFGFALQLQQYWPMFAPHPTKDDGWLIMEAVLADGSRIDLLRGAKPVSFEKPALISAEFRDTKWQKIIVNLWRSPYQNARALFGNHLAFEWNGAHPSTRQIKSWTLWYMREDTPPPNAPPAVPQKVELLRAGAP